MPFGVKENVRGCSAYYCNFLIHGFPSYPFAHITVISDASEHQNWACIFQPDYPFLPLARNTLSKSTHATWAGIRHLWMCIWYLPVDVEAAIVVAFDEKPQHCFAGNDPHPGCLLAPLQSTASPPTITVTTITITITIILTVTITITPNVPVTTITLL